MGPQIDIMLLALYFLLLLAGFETGDARCDHNNNKVGDGFSYKTGGWIPMSPEKRAVRSNIVFKGLLTNRHKPRRRGGPEFGRGLEDDGEFVGEFWVLVALVFVPLEVSERDFDCSRFHYSVLGPSLSAPLQLTGMSSVLLEPHSLRHDT